MTFEELQTFMRVSSLFIVESDTRFRYGPYTVELHKDKDAVGVHDKRQKAARGARVISRKELHRWANMMFTLGTGYCLEEALEHERRVQQLRRQVAHKKP